MQVREKYNNIVNKIEELVFNASHKKEREISEEAFEAGMCYIDDRSKNTLFLFLMEKTVVDYINERRMMAAYKHIITMKEKDFRKAIELSGVQEQSSFIKKFKRLFGMTPKQAFENKDESKILPIKDWDQISQEGKNIIIRLDEDENVLRETKFGISKEMYIRAQRAENLQSFYKLNDLESEFAFGLSDSHSLSLDDAFEYVYNYVWVYAEGKKPDDLEVTARDSRIEEDLLNDDTLYLYFDCDFSFDDIYILLLVKHCNQIKKTFRELGLTYLKECLEYMKPVYNSWEWGLSDKDDFVKEYTVFEKAYPCTAKSLRQKYLKDIYERVREFSEGEQEAIEIVDRVYEKDVLEEGIIQNEEGWDYEPDLDDLDYNQGIYLSFDEEEIYEDFYEDFYDDFDEETFEKLCELEERGDELGADKEAAKALSCHFDLNVLDLGR